MLTHSLYVQGHGVEKELERLEQWLRHILWTTKTISLQPFWFLGLKLLNERKQFEVTQSFFHSVTKPWIFTHLAVHIRTPAKLNKHLRSTRQFVCFETMNNFEDLLRCLKVPVPLWLKKFYFRWRSSTEHQWSAPPFALALH